VECGARHILFDTGSHAGILERNLTRLGLDPTRLDAAVARRPEVLARGDRLFLVYSASG
jgi:hypothetical protein